MHRFISLGFLLCIHFAAAQPGGMGAPPAPVPDVDKETLIIQVPSKWYPYHRTTEAKVETFMFPTGQDPSGWKEALQSEQFLSTLGVTSALQVYEFRTQGANCPEHLVDLTKDGQENGYSFAQWIETCVVGEDTVVTLTKSIVGNDQLYVVNKIWKYKPGNSDIAEWERFLDRVYVCDPTTEGANPCVPPNGPAMGGRPPR